MLVFWFPTAKYPIARLYNSEDSYGYFEAASRRDFVCQSWRYRQHQMQIFQLNADAANCSRISCRTLVVYNLGVKRSSTEGNRLHYQHKDFGIRCGIQEQSEIVAILHLL